MWTTVPFGVRSVEEQVAADEVQVLVADRAVAPQRAADERVEPVGADEDVGLDRRAVGEGERHPVAAVLERGHLVAELEHAGRQRVEHALVQAPAQQADEAAAVLGDDLAGQADARRGRGRRAAELVWHGRAEVLGVDPDQPERPSAAAATG